MTGVRLSAEMPDEITAWAAKQDDKPTKAEAIRRLLEHTPKAKNFASSPTEGAKVDRALTISRRGRHVPSIAENRSPAGLSFDIAAQVVWT